MRIGVDLSNLDPEYAGGMNTFSLGITKGLINVINQPDRLIVLTSCKNEIYIKSIFEGTRIEYLKVPINTLTALTNRLISLCAWMIHSYKIRHWFDKAFRFRISSTISSAVDIILTPTVVLNYYALNVPSVVCIHDIQHEYHPEYFSFFRLILRWAPYRLSCWEAASIQVSSNYVKDCLIDKFSTKPEKMFVAYEGVDVERFAEKSREKRPRLCNDLDHNDFVFYPAQIWPHKNHLLLIDALATARNTYGREIPCVLTGNDYGHWKVILKRIKKHQLKLVYYLGRVEFDEILWLYRNCRAVMALGLHESSSLPIREGAVFGKPLICSDIPPNVEAADYLYLRLVDRSDAKYLASALIELMEEPNDLLSKSALNIARVEVFNWNRIAASYLTVFNQVAAVSNS